MKPYNGISFKYKLLLSSKTKGARQEAKHAEKSGKTSIRQKAKMELKKL